MAKLPSHQFRHKNETGETLEFVSTITLDKDGTFNVTIPDDLYETASGIRPTIDVRMTKPANSHSWRVSGKRLDDCKRFIYAAMDDQLKCEVTTERVIVYGHSLKVAYALANDGSFHPNGYLAQHASGIKGGNNGEGYKWGGELSATRGSPLYTVGLGAKVFDKSIYRRHSGETVAYKHIDQGGFKYGSPLEKLNAFVSLSIDPRYSEQMPYTDEAAMFFYDAMLAMCKLADQVSAFLGDKQTLMLAIEQRVNLLPAPKAV